MFLDPAADGVGHQAEEAGEGQLQAHQSVLDVDDPADGLAQGQEISFEAAHVALEPLDSVVIGDPAHCIEKLKGYQAIGADRMMCLMQFGSIPHDAVLRSFDLAGRMLLPAFPDKVA